MLVAAPSGLGLGYDLRGDRAGGGPTRRIGATSIARWSLRILGDYLLSLLTPLVEVLNLASFLVRFLGADQDQGGSAKGG